MKECGFEITKIDPKRWALLNIPTGVLLGVWQMLAIIKDAGYNAKILWAYLLIPPFAVFVIMGASWIHAKILNMTIRILGKGPIVEGKSLVRDRTGEFKRNSWDR